MTALLDELRAALDAEPITAGDPWRVAVLFEWEMKRWNCDLLGAVDPELHGRLLTDIAQQRAERTMREHAGDTLARVMAVMGYDDDEMREAVANVEVELPEHAEFIRITYVAPKRVTDYMEAVSRGDFLTADLLLRGELV